MTEVIKPTMPKHEPIRVRIHHDRLLERWWWDLTESMGEVTSYSRYHTSIEAEQAARDWIKNMEGREVVVEIMERYGE